MDMSRVVSIFFAFAAVPPALYLFFVLTKEKSIVPVNERGLNKALNTLFLGIATFALANGGISTMALLGLARAHEVAGLRTLMLNIFLSLESWSLLIIRKKLCRERQKR